MDKMNELTLLTQQLVQTEDLVSQLEQDLESAKSKQRRLREETLPELMLELGIDKFVLQTGETISVKQDVYAHIPQQKLKDAMAWLDSNGFGGLIKFDVNMKFGKGDADKARELAIKLSNDGYPVSTKEGVHPQTLRAFLREQLSKGVDVPLELFGATPVNIAKVKR